MIDNASVLYSGKAKTLYATSEPEVLLCHFRDDTSAFDGVKKQKLTHKGMVNNHINAFIMSYLQSEGIETHFIKKMNSTDSLVKKLNMIPVECVVRNVAAGGLCKRLGIEKGKVLEPALFEFFLKDDELHDPMITVNHIRTFGWATDAQIEQMTQISMQVNAKLKHLFEAKGMILVDYKLEFGDLNGEVVLGDEFTPDGCRLWDKSTHKVFDKDRFRQDLGDVVESYKEVAQRLGVQLV